MMAFTHDDVERSIVERFESVVSRFPQYLAVETRNYSLTYADLNTMADRFARELLARRGASAEPVALLFEKDAPLMAAMLGVLKAGKFFVLLDAAFPKARTIAIWEDSQAGAVLTDARNLSLAREIAGDAGCVVEFESIRQDVNDKRFTARVGADSIACVVYTSGSTGMPKGVVQSHRGVLHRVMLHASVYKIRERDRLALLTTGTSNTVVYAFLTLLNGAALRPFDVHKEGAARLGVWLRRQRISICPISSPLFRSFAETLTGAEKFPDLRVIRLTSDTVCKADVDVYRRFFSPSCILVNILSSTETGPLRHYVIDHETELREDQVPVGYPLADKEVLLLDDNGDCVGFHRIGEIVVKSRYLASGYWRRPDLTTAKFKSGAQRDDRTVYFTGDLGLMLPDGQLVHKGRKDLRVKVRGYGVEIEEVERALRAYPHVTEAVVKPSDGDAGDCRLIAYYTLEGQRNVSVGELRRFLAEKLPKHMIPSGFVKLAAIPLTPNGKIDRTHLPEPRISSRHLDATCFPPTNGQEAKLAKIWAEALNLDAVGIHDNFFDLGGDSLLATRVLLRIREVFHVDLPVSALFATPTVANLAARLKDGLLPSNASTPQLHPVSRAGCLPLSFAQRRLWFMAQLEPDSCIYNVASAFRLTGPLNVDALQCSFNEIFRRHEILRTVYRSVEGEPHQVILPSLAPGIALLEAQNIAESGRDFGLSRWAMVEAQRPFDLDRGPLLRASLLRISKNEHVLMVTAHHIVSDGWSKRTLIHELLLLYQAFASGGPSPLQELDIQYTDFAQWQRDSLKQDTLAQQLSYWKRQLHDVSPLWLTPDRVSPPEKFGAGNRIYFAFGETLLLKVKALGARQGATLFMILLAVYQVLLYRYTGQQNFVVGTPIANRRHPTLEKLIGCFVNMLVMRADLFGNPTFHECLDRVRKACLDAYDHQDLPFEKLVEELRPERDGRRNPFFQVTFALENSPRTESQGGSVKASEIEVNSGIARFDLHMVLMEEEDALRGYLDYDTGLFDKETAERLIEHYGNLLEAATGRPDTRIDRLDLMSAVERRRLAEWNDTGKDYSSHKCIHQIFEEQAAHRPDTVAIVCDDGQLTYGHLNARANQLARYLRQGGVGADVRVGVALNRSPEMIVALLAVAKAGGAYVPLHLGYPKERLAFMMRDSGICTLVTRRPLLADLPETSVRLVDLDDSCEVEHGDLANLENVTTPDNLAYVMYTSGSTGIPKGVAIPHRGILRLLLGVSYARFDAHQTWLHLAPVSFDASTLEIWAALLHGGRCVLSSRDIVNASELEDLVRRHSITNVWLTTSLFNAIVDERPDALAGVRQLLIGGEALSIAHVRCALAALPNTEIINAYGPTESTTFASTYSIPRQLEPAGLSIPIGRPISNTQLYVLDQMLEPLPIGVSGELYIGGAGLARGYLNRPETTAERFVPNPFSVDPGTRLYRTGDRARYRSDGNIEFLGRLDDQIKIRGFRVEPGEIENTLARHPGVRQAVVEARQSAVGEKRLIAYIVPSGDRTPDPSELREFLRLKLPDYMLPSAFVTLDAVPLTANGKLDRQALPNPGQSRPSIAQAFVPPRTSSEAAVAKIWSEILQVEEIGADDNFFELGGHSLLATKAIMRLSEMFQTEVPLRSLFENATVATLAAEIERLESVQSSHEEIVRILDDLEAMSDHDAVTLTDRDKSHRRLE